MKYCAFRDVSAETVLLVAYKLAWIFVTRYNFLPLQNTNKY